MGEREHDREDLDETIRMVRERFPDAVSFDLSSSDQDTVGFALTGVAGPGGEFPAAGVDRLADDVWYLVSSLGWDGLVGEDKQGYATVRIPHA